MIKSLFVITNYDTETLYSATYCKEIIDIAERRQGKKNVIIVMGQKVVSSEVVPRLEALRPHFFIFSGHGTETSLKGHHDVLLMDVNTCSSLRDTIVFSRACNAVVDLGRKAVDKGCRAFVGYKKKFWGVATDGYASRPLDDPNAKEIYENSNVVPVQILKGATVEQAIRDAHKDAAKRLLRLLNSSDPGANAALLALSSNDSVLSFQGDSKAVLDKNV